MKIQRFTVQACCGKKSVVFKTDKPLTKEILNYLVNNGFKELTHFTKAGILYLENNEFVLTGPIGADRLQIKCKLPDCDQKINNLEELLANV